MTAHAYRCCNSAFPAKVPTTAATIPTGCSPVHLSPVTSEDRSSVVNTVTASYAVRGQKQIPKSMIFVVVQSTTGDRTFVPSQRAGGQTNLKNRKNWSAIDDAGRQ